MSLSDVSFLQSPLWTLFIALEFQNYAPLTLHLPLSFPHVQFFSSPPTQFFRFLNRNFRFYRGCPFVFFFFYFSTANFFGVSFFPRTHPVRRQTKSPPPHSFRSSHYFSPFTNLPLPPAVPSKHLLFISCISRLPPSAIVVFPQLGVSFPFLSLISRPVNLTRLPFSLFSLIQVRLDTSWLIQ